MKSLESLIPSIENLKPWHQIIELNENLTTATPFVANNPYQTVWVSESRSIKKYQGLERNEKGSVSLIDCRPEFMELMNLIYPDGMKNKRLLDCACNAGGFCFWSKELGAEFAYGFDVRQHWIEQAEFVLQHRTIASTSNVEFSVCDLYELDQLGLDVFDVTIFQGIFYHLPYPIEGLKKATDLTKDLIWLNTAFNFVAADGLLQPKLEGTEQVMSGVHRLSWLPTGPVSIAKILRSLGFKEIRLVKSCQYQNHDYLGRLGIIARREESLDGLNTVSLKIDENFEIVQPDPKVNLPIRASSIDPGPREINVLQDISRMASGSKFSFKKAHELIISNLFPQGIESNQLFFIETDANDQKISIQAKEVVVYRDVFGSVALPITSLKNAASATTNIFIFGSQIALGEQEGYLKSVVGTLDSSQPDIQLSWLPTGAGVIVYLLKWFGFHDIRLLSSTTEYEIPKNRIEIVAARQVDKLELINSISTVLYNH